MTDDGWAVEPSGELLPAAPGDSPGTPAGRPLAPDLPRLFDEEVRYNSAQPPPASGST
jgi:hypothetical protein